ncbi:MAG: AAA family ATPase [bacterium]|nr:AAA family ATPase [bacterium]
MLLKRIELAGFKSFARPSVLEFKTPITAIVGPNGSGKSNVAEAVRFVLGEQSIKSLRGKRGEDLIFNGTHSLSRQGKASVTIVFDNTGRVFNIDYDEVSIKRVIYRDSASEYIVNGSHVRLKDILEMLSSVHIGASSHHIISQGESDRILLASMQERRSMIEDALGLKIYHYKKMESVRKLLKTRENLEQVKALKKEIEPHLKFLEKQVAKIKRGEALREELKNLYAIYFAQEKKYLDEQKRKLLAEKEGPEKELKEVGKKIKNFEDAIQKAKENAHAEDSLFDLERKMKDVEEKKDSLSRLLGRIEGVIEYEEQKLKEESVKPTEEKRAVITLESVNELEKTLADYKARVDTEENIVTLRGILSEVQDAIKDFFSRFIVRGENNTTVPLLKESLVKKRTEKEKITHDLALVKNEHASLHTTYTELRKKTEHESSKEREGEREFFLLQNKKTELVSKIELCAMREEQYNALKADFDFFREEARALVGTTLHDEPSVVSTEEERSKQDERRRSIERMKIRLEEIGAGGSDTLKEYKEVKERDEFLGKEILDLEKSAETLGVLIKELEEKIDEQFKEGIQKINNRFQELFVLMFGGGKALLKVLAPLKRKLKKGGELEETSEEAPEENVTLEHEEDGIEIDISLPRKKIKGLQMLSGGERALTSIALIFAMTQVNPPPFLILDETDAALDEANSQIYGKMLETLAKETELILITHNRETMAHASVLYGVTAVDGVSRLLSVKFDEAKELTQ